jgi:hypothetical protein
MKLHNLMFVVLIAVFTAASGFAVEVKENEKLGDVMYLLVDTYSGLGEFAKKAPATVEAKDFGRAVHRARGGAFLLNLINEKKGEVVDGKFVPGDLTPGKFLTAEGEELAAMMNRFSDLLKGAAGLFDKAEAELKIQLAKSPEEKNFRSLKLILADIDSAIKQAHKEFKPEHR